jgi:hypothetical protein
LCTCRVGVLADSGTYRARKKQTSLYIIDYKRLIVAERVGFAPPPVVEIKELKVFWLPPDQPDPLKSPGRDTY